MVYFAPLSLIGSLLLVIAIVIARQEERNQSKTNHMSNILWMSISDFGYSLRCCIPFFGTIPNTESILCSLSAIPGIFFMMATQSWYFIISLQIFVTIQCKKTPRCMTSRYMVHIFVWALSITTTLLSYGKYTVSPDNDDCWIVQSQVYQLHLFIPSTIYLFFAMTLSCFLSYTLHSVLQGRKQKNILIRTWIYVGVFVFTWFPTWIVQLLRIISIDPVYWFERAAVATSTMSGFLNFIVWSNKIHMYRRFKSLFKKPECLKNNQTYVEKDTYSSINNTRFLYPSGEEKKLSWKIDWNKKESKKESEHMW